MAAHHSAIFLVASFSLGFEWEDVDAVFRVVSLGFFGLIAGAAFGVISGAVLVWLLRNGRRVSSPAMPEQASASQA